MRFIYLLAALTSAALVSAAAIPGPQGKAVPTFKCGCTNDCIIGCGSKTDCFCPLYCDPKYECPEPTPTTTERTVDPTATCGCLNDCIIGCRPDPRLCRCSNFCDPKYECPVTTTTTTTTTKKPTKTTTSAVLPTFTCGCTNACKIACGNKPDCICPQYCDPQYECPPTRTTTIVKPTFTCGCTNDCLVNCKEPPCACPKNCDPKYACPATLVPYSLIPLPTATTVPCGCHNDCTLTCKKPGCACLAYCDPKYLCTS